MEPLLGDFRKRDLIYRFETAYFGHDTRFDYINSAIGQVVSSLVPNTNYTGVASTVLFLNNKTIDIERRTVLTFRTTTVGK